ncbi:MAG: signal recognition particle protein [Planctomycetota bacterium]
MFDRITDTLNGAFRKLSGQGTISEDNVREAMADVRTALLEADVHYDVVKDFTEGVVQDAIGREVTKSLKPGQEMIGIVNRRLVELLGGDPDATEEDKKLSSGPMIMKVSPGPTVVMMCGLQGSGKTTTCGKLAGYLKKRGRSVMLAAADLQRPAAIEQLEIVAQTAQQEISGPGTVSFYGEPDKAAEYGKAVNVAVGVCQRALAEARKQNVDVLILDTAGRLHVNDELMGELNMVTKALAPQHIFLVTDAMVGQDAVNSAKAFHERLTVDGLILTKFDSDTRGGAALSVKTVTGAPIKFIGTGEKLDALEEFHADRMAGRILGMGDVVSLVEKAQEQVSEEEAEKLQNKMMRGELGMDDFLKQLKMLKKMGPMKQLLGMLPGVGQMLKDVDVDDKQFVKVEAMIQSMTPEERKKPSVINPARRRRISAGSGTQTNDVGQLTKQFDAINKLTKQMGGMSGGGKMAAAEQLTAGGLGMPGLTGMPNIGRSKGSTKAGGRAKSRPKKRKRR